MDQYSLKHKSLEQAEEINIYSCCNTTRFGNDRVKRCKSIGKEKIAKNGPKIYITKHTETYITRQYN